MDIKKVDPDLVDLKVWYVGLFFLPFFPFCFSLFLSSISLSSLSLFSLLSPSAPLFLSTHLILSFLSLSLSPLCTSLPLPPPFRLPLSLSPSSFPFISASYSTFVSLTLSPSFMTFDCTHAKRKRKKWQ